MSLGSTTCATPCRAARLVELVGAGVHGDAHGADLLLRQGQVPLAALIGGGRQDGLQRRAGVAELRVGALHDRVHDAHHRLRMEAAEGLQQTCSSSPAVGIRCSSFLPGVPPMVCMHDQHARSCGPAASLGGILQCMTTTSHNVGSTCSSLSLRNLQPPWVKERCWMSGHGYRSMLDV